MEKVRLVLAKGEEVLVELQLLIFQNQMEEYSLVSAFNGLAPK